MKKTPDEWLKEPKYSGITVVDPDGWDRINFEQSWAEPITEVEFTARVMMSSCLLQQVGETDGRP